MAVPKIRFAEKGPSTVIYSTRSMPVDLLDRMRILKTYMYASIECVLNEALDLGLRELEERHIHKRGEGK